MVEDKKSKPLTHTAWAIQQRRIGKMTVTRALEIGQGRDDEEGAHLFLDRMPLGGFTGYVKLLPNGIKPALAPPQPVEDDDEADDKTGEPKNLN